MMHAIAACILVVGAHRPTLSGRRERELQACTVQLPSSIAPCPGASWLVDNIARD